MESRECGYTNKAPCLATWCLIVVYLKRDYFTITFLPFTM